MQQGMQQGIQQGIQQGLEQGKKEIVIRMLKRNSNIEEIKELTGLTEAKIKEIKKYIK